MHWFLRFSNSADARSIALFVSFYEEQTIFGGKRFKIDECTGNLNEIPFLSR